MFEIQLTEQETKKIMISRIKNLIFKIQKLCQINKERQTTRQDNDKGNKNLRIKTNNTEFTEIPILFDKHF